VKKRFEGGDFGILSLARRRRDLDLEFLLLCEQIVPAARFSCTHLAKPDLRRRVFKEDVSAFRDFFDNRSTTAASASTVMALMKF
jgi:hypothetical protein